MNNKILSKEDLINIFKIIESYKIPIENIEIPPDVLQDIIDWKQEQIKEDV